MLLRIEIDDDHFVRGTACMDCTLTSDSIHHDMPCLFCDPVRVPGLALVSSRLISSLISAQIDRK